VKPGQVTAAVGLGYLLGRTKKMRLAMMIAAAGAASRLGDKSPDLLRRVGLADIPEVGDLTESLRGGVLEAARTAAMAVATNTVKSLNSKLTDQPGSQRADDDEHEDEPQDEPEDDDTQDEDVAEDEDEEEEEEPEEEPEPEPEKPRRSTRRSSSSRAATPSRARAKPARRTRK
jgi:hypothetical protein